MITVLICVVVGIVAFIVGCLATASKINNALSKASDKTIRITKEGQHPNEQLNIFGIDIYSYLVGRTEATQDIRSDIGMYVDDHVKIFNLLREERKKKFIGK